MKKSCALMLMLLAGVLFAAFQFVVVKIAYFKYPEGREYDSFAELLVDAWTRPEAPNGVYHEIYGPVSAIRNFVYVFCSAGAICGVIFFIGGRRKIRSRH